MFAEQREQIEALQDCPPLTSMGSPSDTTRLSKCQPSPCLEEANGLAERELQVPFVQCGFLNLF